MGKDTEPTSTSEGNFYTEGKVLGGFIMAATEYERMKNKETGIRAVREHDNTTPSSYSLLGIKLNSQSSLQNIFIKEGKKYHHNKLKVR